MSRELRDRLEALPEPDPAAIDRMWVRFLTTQALEPRRRRRRRIAGAMTVVALAATAVLWFTAPEPPRRMDLGVAVTPEHHEWSPEIRLEALGEGAVSGVSRDATIQWSSGTVRVEVEPHTGTQLTVVTKEAHVRVVGTRFDVQRDGLGSTITVDHGRVAVQCGDGWHGDLTAGQHHTCLPLTPAELLGRATALLDDGRGDEVSATLDRGLALADGPVRGELLARRMRLRASEGDVDGALADATAYLASPSGRDDEVRRFAGWLALEHRGCAAATSWLVELHAAGSVTETVLLAECLAESEPERARQMLVQVRPALQGDWQDRADAALERVLEVLR